LTIDPSEGFDGFKPDFLMTFSALGLSFPAMIRKESQESLPEKIENGTACPNRFKTLFQWNAVECVENQQPRHSHASREKTQNLLYKIRTGLRRPLSMQNGVPHQVVVLDQHGGLNACLCQGGHDAHLIPAAIGGIISPPSFGKGSDLVIVVHPEQQRASV